MSQNNLIKGKVIETDENYIVQGGWFMPDLFD